MIVLPGTSDVIRIITSAAVALDAHVDYVDHTTSAYTPGRQNTAISTATTTTICSAPGASTQRQVKHMTLCARGGANTVTVQYFDGSTAFQLVGSFSLADEDTLEYTDTDGFRVFDSTGNLKVSGSISATDAVAGVARFATQAEMEAETGSLIVTPARAHFSPSAAKFWVGATGTSAPAISQSYNVASIADPGVGVFTVTFTTAFSAADYCVLATMGTAAGNDKIASYSSRTTTSVTIRCNNGSGTAEDPNDGYCAAGFGDQ